MAALIHPTTVVTGEAQIDDGVEIGPYCLIQGKVRIKKGTFVEGHVTLGSRHGVIEIGENNHIAPGAVIGGPPQDISYKSEPTMLVIGDNNVIREFTTLNIATSKGDKKTEIGNNNYLMSYTHIGHDCKIGNGVVIANNSHLGGHTVIEDGVVIGGVCAFNQHVRVGKGAFVAGSSVLRKDILPFCRAEGNSAVARATNKVGLLRKGVSKEEVQNIHRAIRILVMGAGTLEFALERIQKECQMTSNIEYMIQFIRASKRGIGRPTGKSGESEEDSEMS
jgi:UDP-N-acetylglucosamine acyltransferase